ncbi:hypothetical protein HYS97_02945 [Candidatus Daviesbacteria bacterium]|nr:hypothetical protein [Candidatus Daviesbacteria bacterium]
MDKNLKSWLIKQNILKNLTVIFVTIVLILWTKTYISGIEKSGLDAILFLSIFPLGAMFAYFAFSYSETNLKSPEHRALADLSTLIFLTIISFSVAFSTLLGVLVLPQLAVPFTLMAVLLISGCLVYDFWNLYSNLEKTD